MGKYLKPVNGGWWMVMGLLLLPACSDVSHTYSRVLHDWTRHKQAYNLNSLRAESILHAVLLTPAMREARVVREAALRGWSREAVDRILPPAWDASGTNFFVGLYAPKEFQKLALAEEDYWHLELVLPSGEVVEPVGVEEVELSPVDRKLFPFLTQWSRGYFVRFAPTVDQGVLRLSLKGLNARSELVWRVE